MDTLFDSLLADEPIRPGQVIIEPMYGGAAKSPHELSLAEWSAVSEQVMAKVRERAFSRGLAVIGEVDGVTVQTWADGRVEPVIR
jgi:hypothetical protein